MKRFWILMLLGGLLASCNTSLVAMGSSDIRRETRFLTDKMAYELDLSYAQYDDVYEINYDFIAAVSRLMDDVVRGYAWAVDEYYYRLDLRNDDLRWVLSNSQYRRFMGLDYFFRPVYLRGPRWSFRVYLVYTDHNHFYFPKPHHYRTYRGGHCRHGFDHPSYYRNRHNHPHYTGTFRVSTGSSRSSSFSADFGSVRILPNTSVRSSTGSVRSTDTNRSSRSSTGTVRSTENSRSSRSSNTGTVRSTENSRSSRSSNTGTVRSTENSRSSRSSNTGTVRSTENSRSSRSSSSSVRSADNSRSSRSKSEPSRSGSRNSR